MSLFSYKRYKIRIAPDSKRSQGLRCGDVVRRQYRDEDNLIYSLMVVLSTGVDTIDSKSSPYFIGALVEGVTPQNGELLDFVRISNLLDEDRSGALYLTASDSTAPYLDVVDGMATEKSVLYVDHTTRITTDNPIFKPSATSRVGHPERLLILLKVRASKALSDVPLSFGYLSGEQNDGVDSISIGTDWEYRLSVMTVDYPKEYDRCLTLDFTNHLLTDDWCEIAEVNVVPLSAVANFSESSKVRVGKITGINDPLFGVLDGYGAYFQNLYATRNINIAGTLTAGDENGYASTFYVGRIHKNCFVNSLEGVFITPTAPSNHTTPVGIGNVAQLPIGVSTIVLQTNEWLKENVGERYCFSFYALSTEAAEIGISLLESLIRTETVNENWQRIHISFTIPPLADGDLCVDITSDTIFHACAYQLEKGKTPSLYQPTDLLLTNTDEYGAWFSRGGIGGTIQNPLLKLNSDGSISSRDDSFVINADGTGHFSGGRFKWTKDTIELQDVAIIWKDLDDEAKENLSATAGVVSVQVLSSNGSGFVNDPISTTLTTKVYRGVSEITRTLADTAFNWSRLSDNAADDTAWGEAHQGVGRSISISDYDVNIKAVFSCDVLVGATSTEGQLTICLVDKGASGDKGDKGDIGDKGDKGDSGNKGDVGENIGGGKMLYRDPEFRKGVNSCDLFNDLQNGAVAIKRIVRPIDCPTTSTHCLEIKATGPSSHGHGGYCQAIESRPNAMFVQKIVAKIPIGYTLCAIANLLGEGGEDVIITNAEGTGKYETYLRQTACGASGSFSTGGYLYLSGGEDASVESPLIWHVASSTVYDMSSSESYDDAITTAQATADAISETAQNEGWATKLTYIDSHGIFTGTLSANTVNAVHINASQITAGTIDAARLNVEELKATLITAANINALTLTAVKGTIGGWGIGADHITAGSIGEMGATPIQLRTKSSGSGSWFSGAYKPYGISMLWYNGSNAGHIVLGQIAASGSSAKTGFMGLQMMSWNGLEYFCLSANAKTTTGSREVYNRIAGWAFDSSRIWKNSVSLGDDGSISNGDKWQLNNDGSGRMANGNIVWNSLGTVTFGFDVSLNWTAPINSITTALGGSEYSKLTHITSTGIYTGTLTAEQVNAVNINASSITTGLLNADRITAGSITVDKLDVESLKAEIINTTYINGLSCTFGKGTIGGWEINSGSIYGGQIILDRTNNRIAVYSTSSSSTTGHRVQLHYASNRDFGLYATDSSGAMVLRLGSSNSIAGWSITPERIYKNSVSLGSDGSITNGSKWRLNSDGSGTLANGNIAWNSLGVVTFSESVSLNWTAAIEGVATEIGSKLTQITSTGIYTGTLTANQINVVGINAANITTGSLSADRITAGSITVDKLDVESLKAEVINTSYISGLGCTFVTGTIGGWVINNGSISGGNIILDRSNKRIAVYGANSSSTHGHRVQLHHTSNSSFGLYATNSAGAMVVSLGSSNSIAGWIITPTRIYKNSVSLGADGSIANGTKWQLNNDGSGRLANGNITWDSLGKVTFDPSVSINWSDSANELLEQAKGGAELASAMAAGKMMYRDPTFSDGTNGTSVYNNSGNGTVTMSRTLNLTAPNDTRRVLRIVNTGASSPGCGGFSFGTRCFYSKVLVTRIIAKIPIGRSICFATNSIGTDGSYKWLTATEGTGNWCEYAIKVACGTSNLDSTNFYYINGAYGVTWEVAYATVFDATSIEGFTTTITSEGIYTGTLIASQITAGTINANLINTTSLKATLITADNINALTMTLNKGTIGGWNINSYQISKNSVVFSSDGSIRNGTKWQFNNDGSGQLAGGAISWNTLGKFTATGGVFNNVRINGSMRSHFVRNDPSMWIGGDTSTQEGLKNFDNVVTTSNGEYVALSWTMEDSGRRICIANYRWHNTISTGYTSMGAPSGKHFFEDGIAKTSLRFSKELLELIGYGDDQTFFGWIVINRIDLMTSGKYGSVQRVLAQGCVSSTGSLTQYHTFDGSTMSATRTSEGMYVVYMPSNWGLAGKFLVMLTGVKTTTPIYATIASQHSYYFYVQTNDDSTPNDGAFNFQITSTANWGH